MLSPLKSPTATEIGLLLAVLKLVAAPKLPAPLPNNTETLCESWFVVTRSIFPSLLKSPTATALGLFPIPKLAAAAKLAEPQEKTAAAVWHAENSEVLPAGSVAVAVMFSPGATAFVMVASKVALPAALVVTVAEPTKVSPSPLPEASQVLFE